MKTLIAAALSLTLIAGAVAPVHADDRGRDNDRRGWRGDGRRHDDHRYDLRDYRTGYVGRRDARHYDAPRYIAPRGYHAREWRRGDRLPRAYYSSRYVIRDYGAYRLRAPPRGHHWVRVDNDVLLTAIATGAVVAVVSGLFH